MQVNTLLFLPFCILPHTFVEKATHPLSTWHKALWEEKGTLCTQNRAGRQAGILSDKPLGSLQPLQSTACLTSPPLEEDGRDTCGGGGLLFSLPHHHHAAFCISCPVDSVLVSHFFLSSSHCTLTPFPSLWEEQHGFLQPTASAFCLTHTLHLLFCSGFCSGRHLPCLPACPKSLIYLDCSYACLLCTFHETEKRGTGHHASCLPLPLSPGQALLLTLRGRGGRQRRRRRGEATSQGDCTTYTTACIRLQKACCREEPLSEKGEPHSGISDGEAGALNRHHYHPFCLFGAFPSTFPQLTPCNIYLPLKGRKAGHAAYML